MIVTISKINRTTRKSKKTGKDFVSLGIAPSEETLMDINGDEFARDGRWLSGFESEATKAWKEGDKVKINLVRVKGKKADGSDAEFINFRLPEGIDPMVEKAADAPDPDDF